MKFSYIIVGGGTSGCILANRLSRDKYITVLLIEAGGSNNNSILNTELGSQIQLLSGSKDTLWNQYEEIEPNSQYGQATNDGTVPLWTGKGLGGTSIVAFGYYETGNEEEWSRYLEKHDLEYDSIQKNHENIKKQVETKYNPINDKDFVSALGQMPSRPIPIMKKNAKQLFINTIKKRDNLKIVTNAEVKKIIWDDNDTTKAIGVMTSKKAFYCSKEVILSCGTYLTPKCLYNSGIPVSGTFKDQTILRLNFGTLDNNAVTKFISNLQSNANNVMTLAKQLIGITTYQDNNVVKIETKKGGIIWLVHSFSNINSIYNYKTKYDVEITNGFTAVVSLKHPTSIGTLDFKNNTIKTNCNATQEDMILMIDTIRTVFEILEHSNMPYKDQFKSPAGFTEHEFDTNDYWRDYIRYFSRPYDHAIASTSDIVDADFRVRDTTNLRVVDASVMHDWVSFQPIGSLYVLADYAADKIEHTKIQYPYNGQGLRAAIISISLIISFNLIYDVAMPYFIFKNKKFRLMMIMIYIVLMQLCGDAVDKLPGNVPFIDLLKKHTRMSYAIIILYYVLIHTLLPTYKQTTKTIMVIEKCLDLARYLLIDTNNICAYCNISFMMFLQTILPNRSLASIINYKTQEYPESTFAYINKWKTYITIAWKNLICHTSILKIITFVYSIGSRSCLKNIGVHQNKKHINESMFFVRGFYNMQYNPDTKVITEKLFPLNNKELDNSNKPKYTVDYIYNDNKWNVNAVTKGEGSEMKQIVLTDEIENEIYIMRHNLDIGTYHTALHVWVEQYAMILYRYASDNLMKRLLDCFFINNTYNNTLAVPVVFETAGILNKAFGASQSLLHNLQIENMDSNMHYVMKRLKEQNLDKIPNIETNYNFIITKKYDDLG